MNQDTNDGLSDQELNKMSQSLPGLSACFMGVFTKDKLPDMRRQTSCAIVNLENSDQGGSHWVACGNKNGEGWYFDSFGLDIPPDIKKRLPSKPWRENSELQAEASDLCGLYALAACNYVMTSKKSVYPSMDSFERMFNKPILDDNDLVLVKYFRKIV